MPSNLIKLKSVDQFMADYVSRYSPIYPLLLSNSQQYQMEVGKQNFKRLEAVGDLDVKIYLPKDTEVHQVAVREGEKTFKKYPLLNQFVLSTWQDSSGVDEVAKQILDRLQVQMDIMAMGTAHNSGIFTSTDSNYVSNISGEIAYSDRLYDFHEKIMSTAAQADVVGGRKVILFYGHTKSLTRKLFPSSSKAFRTALQETLPGYGFTEVPDACTPSGQNGWLVLNLDQIKTHYTLLPQLYDRDTDRKEMSIWQNFAMGSCMVDLLAEGAIIKQPTTLASED